MGQHLLLVTTSGSFQSWQKGKFGRGVSHDKRKRKLGGKGSQALFNNQISHELIEQELSHYFGEDSEPFMRDLPP